MDQRWCLLRLSFNVLSCKVAVEFIKVEIMAQVSRLRPKILMYVFGHSIRVFRAMMIVYDFNIGSALKIALKSTKNYAGRCRYMKLKLRKK